jgi:branched-chain amino acid transport system ATP-binding protein
MLDVTGLTSGYGKALAIEDISLGLGEAGSLAILGRNGAGKSTLLKTVMGLIRPWHGTVTLHGRNIAGLPSHAIAEAGLGYVPEERRIFESLSVTENLLAGAKPGPGGKTRWTQARAFELFPEIARRHAAAAGTLSGGERQMLAIARALMGNPDVLLLDEPSEGLAPVVVRRLGDALSALRGDGISILISEQNRRLARVVAERAVILESGRTAWQGSFAELDAAPETAARYLGV